MLRKKGGRAFPYVIFMDPKGEKLFQFRPNNESITKTAVRDANLILKGRTADSDDEVAAANSLLAEALRELSFPTVEEVKAASEVDGVDPGLTDRLQSYLANKPVDDAVRTYRERLEKARKETKKSDRQKIVSKIEKRCAEETYSLYKSGVQHPSRSAASYTTFWYLVARGALDGKDRWVAENAVRALSQSPTAKRMQQTIARLEDELKRL